MTRCPFVTYIRRIAQISFSCLRCGCLDIAPSFSLFFRGGIVHRFIDEIIFDWQEYVLIVLSIFPRPIDLILGYAQLLIVNVLGESVEFFLALGRYLEGILRKDQPLFASFKAARSILESGVAASLSLFLLMIVHSLFQRNALPACYFAYL